MSNEGTATPSTEDTEMSGEGTDSPSTENIKMSDEGTATPLTENIKMSGDGTATTSTDNIKMSDEGTATTSTDNIKTSEDGTASSSTENIHMSDEKTDSKTEEVEEEYTDVLGNKTLLKKIITPGSGRNPVRGEKVSITIQRSIPELGKEFPVQDITFVLGDCDVEQASELVIALMKVRERATVIAGYRYMFGEMGCEPDIPACANFKLDIHLKENHGIPDYSTMLLEERFSVAKAKKERGNFYFRRQEYGQSIFVYSKASKVMDPTEGFLYPDAAPETLQEILEFRGILFANISVAQLKVGSTAAAIQSALEATQLCPTYSKAFFRLGQAYEQNKMMDEAIKSLKLALKNDPENSKIIHTELSRMTKVNREAKQAEKDMYGKMFWGSKPPGAANSKKPKVKDDASLNSSPIATTSSQRSPRQTQNASASATTSSQRSPRQTQNASASATTSSHSSPRQTQNASPIATTSSQRSPRQTQNASPIATTSSHRSPGQTQNASPIATTSSQRSPRQTQNASPIATTSRYRSPGQTQDASPIATTSRYRSPRQTQNASPIATTSSHRSPGQTQNASPIATTSSQRSPGQTQNASPIATTSRYRSPGQTQNASPIATTIRYRSPGQTQNASPIATTSSHRSPGQTQNASPIATTSSHRSPGQTQNASPIATTSSHRSPRSVMAPDWYFTKQQALAKCQVGAPLYSTNLDSGETYIEAEMTVEPVVDIVDAFKEEDKKASWFTNPLMWGTIGAGIAGAASLGLYKYFH